MPVTQTWIDQLDVRVYPDRDEMGRSAAQEAAQAIRGLLAEREEVNLIFAAAPSQSEFLRALCAEGDIDWGKRFPHGRVCGPGGGPGGVVHQLPQQEGV